MNTVEWTISTLPSYASFGIDATAIRSAFGFQPAATAFVRGIDGKLYAYVFPTLFFTGPSFPGLEFVQTASGSFELSRVLNSVSMGSGRDGALLSEPESGVSQFVMVDHGPEYQTGYATWPFGHVWVATDQGDGFVFQQISTVAGFNHSVDVGDLNDDGLNDIVVSHMGVKSGGVIIDLHAFMQTSNGSFVQDPDFARSLQGSWGSGAVAIANLNGTAGVEIVQANYGYAGSSDWGGLRILQRDAAGDYVVAATLSRQGLFLTMGASQVVPFDFDLDGDLDLVLALEGGYPGLQGRFRGNGIDIYENDGHGQFQLVSSQQLDRNSWSFEELQFRELSVVDFDFDGYPDLVFNGWAGNLFRAGNVIDMGVLLFRNMSGEGFTQLLHTPALEFAIARFDDQPQYLRFVESRGGITEFFGITHSGAPISVVVPAMNREGSEVLNVSGIGTEVWGFEGDDIFLMNGSSSNVIGGSGTDTIRYASASAGARPTSDGLTGDWSISRSSIDHLAGIERVTFTDISIALDLSGHAGTTAKLLGAVFGRSAVFNAQYVGIGLSLLDAGMTYEELMALAINFALGSNASNTLVVNHIYTNVVGSPPPSSTLDYYVALLDSGAYTAAALGMLAAETPLNQLNIGMVGLSQTGLDYLPA